MQLNPPYHHHHTAPSGVSTFDIRYPTDMTRGGILIKQMTVYNPPPPLPPEKTTIPPPPQPIETGFYGLLNTASKAAENGT